MSTYIPRAVDFTEANLPDKASQVYEWMWLIFHFSNRSMTFERDKLPAISALASEFGRLRTDRYLAGSWEADLIMTLPWRASRPSVRASLWRAPSWSWVSIHAGCIGIICTCSTNCTVIKTNSRHLLIRNYEVHVEVISTIASATYGKILSGFLVIQCRMKEAKRLPRVEIEGQNFTDLHIFDGQEGCCSSCMVYYDEMSLHDAHINGDESKELYCIKTNTDMGNPEYRRWFGITYTTYGLVLTRMKQNSYERVGLFEYSCPCKHNEDPFHDGELEEIVIY